MNSRSVPRTSSSTISPTIRGCWPCGGNMSFDAAKLAADTEAFCQELRPEEEVCYAERRKNELVKPLAQKHNLLGMNISEQYGGRGADHGTYFKALTRIGHERQTSRAFLQ